MSNGFVDMAILSEINRQRTKDAHETWKRKKEENSLGDQLTEVKEALKSEREESLNLRAMVEGRDALISAFREALYAENPKHPLVNPLAPGKNFHRQQIVEDAQRKALNNFTANSGNIWRAPTMTEQANRAEHELLLAQLREEQTEHLESVGCLKNAVADLSGQTALVHALRDALHEASPENPLVSPFESGENIIREQIYQKARQRRLNELNKKPEY